MDQRITFDRVMLDEALAERLLEKNKNRYGPRALERQGERFRDIILSGSWVENPASPIVLDEDGYLRDGQSRCTGVILAEQWNREHEPDRTAVQVPAWLMTGVDEGFQLVQDTSNVRRFSHWLQMQGLPDSSGLGAVTTLLWHYQHGHLRTRGTYYRRRRAEHTDLWTLFRDRREQVIDATYKGQQDYRRCRLPASVSGAARIIFSDIKAGDQELLAGDIAEFFALVTSRSDHTAEKGSGPQLLQRFVLRNHGKRLDQQEWLAIVIKAWNMYRSGEVKDNLRWRTGGSSKENFPVPE